MSLHEVLKGHKENETNNFVVKCTLILRFYNEFCYHYSSHSFRFVYSEQFICHLSSISRTGLRGKRQEVSSTACCYRQELRGKLYSFGFLCFRNLAVAIKKTTLFQEYIYIVSLGAFHFNL